VDQVSIQLLQRVTLRAAMPARDDMVMNGNEGGRC